MNTKIPLAIFAYNRPRHLSQLFDSLLNCARLDECQVYIFCDGAKKPEHLENVRAAREVARGYSSRLGNVRLIERGENLGLAHSIVTGITELCQQYGRVIVLEDDFILHPFFLDFMLQSLDRYADDDRVAQVAGYLPPIHPEVETDTFFLPLTTSCSWATWQRAWKLFSWETESALQVLDADPQMRFHFDLDGAYPYSDMLRLAIEGKVDSWAIRWYWRTFYHKKLTLYPCRSLVWVGGFDDLATHTTSEEIPKFYDQPLDFILQSNWNIPTSFPLIAQADETAFEKLKNFIRPKLPHTPMLARLKGIYKHVLTWLIK